MVCRAIVGATLLFVANPSIEAQTSTAREEQGGDAKSLHEKLLVCLGNDSEVVRYSALSILSAADESIGENRRDQLLRDDSPRIRRAALWHITGRADAEGRVSDELLLTLARDEDERVAVTALDWVAVAPGFDSSQQLLQILRESQGVRQLYALAALSRFRGDLETEVVDDCCRQVWRWIETNWNETGANRSPSRSCERLGVAARFLPTREFEIFRERSALFLNRYAVLMEHSRETVDLSLDEQWRILWSGGASSQALDKFVERHGVSAIKAHRRQGEWRVSSWEEAVEETARLGACFVGEGPHGESEQQAKIAELIQELSSRGSDGRGPWWLGYEPSVARLNLGFLSEAIGQGLTLFPLEDSWQPWLERRAMRERDEQIAANLAHFAAEQSPDVCVLCVYGCGHLQTPRDLVSALSQSLGDRPVVELWVSPEIPSTRHVRTLDQLRHQVFRHTDEPLYQLTDSLDFFSEPLDELERALKEL